MKPDFPLMSILKDCHTKRDVVERLVERNIIPRQVYKDLQIYNTYQQKRQSLPRLTAVFDTAIEHRVSERKVYYVRKKFRKREH